MTVDAFLMQVFRDSFQEHRVIAEGRTCLAKWYNQALDSL
jgi:hypothetical protein